MAVIESNESLQPFEVRAPLAGISQATRRLGNADPGITVGMRTGDTPAEERVKVIATGQDWPATDFTLTQESYGRRFQEGDVFEVRAKLTKLDGDESEWSGPYRTPPVPYVAPKPPEIGSITWSTD